MSENTFEHQLLLAIIIPTDIHLDMNDIIILWDNCSQTGSTGMIMNHTMYAVCVKYRHNNICKILGINENKRKDELINLELPSS